MVDKLVYECTENIDEVKVAEKTLTENIRKCSSSIMYIMLLSTNFLTDVGISTCFFTINIWISIKKCF